MDITSYPSYEKYCEIKSRGSQTLPKVEWERIRFAFDWMDEKISRLTKTHPDDLYPAIGEGYPCFLWVQRLVEICPKHGEIIDPSDGCNTCYIDMMAEIEESAIEAGFPRPFIDLNYRGLKKQLDKSRGGSSE